MPFPRRVTRTSSRLGLIAAFGIIAIALSGCAGTVSLRPAEASNDPACAEVMVRLPPKLDGAETPLEKRTTDAQSTAAWGTPDAAVIFRCGVTPPGPTTLDCVTSSTNVDWVIDPSGEGDGRTYLATTFGREPAIDVFIVLNRADPQTILDEISMRIYEHIPATATCTDRPGA